MGVDSRQISSELDKLDVYLDERREVTEHDVRMLVPLSHAGVVFEIGNALQKKNAGRAFELIDQQLARKETAIGILRASIIPTVRNLFMSAAVTDGRSIPTEIITSMPVPSMPCRPMSVPGYRRRRMAAGSVSTLYFWPARMPRPLVSAGLV